MDRLTRDQLFESLQALGVERGDIVHVQSDLRRIGPIDGPMTPDGICNFYLNGLRDFLGPEGTVTTCTSFEDFGRWGTPFIRETSPSRLGILSEYIRIQNNAVRSIHPILSVTGIGKRAEEICGGAHYDGFGWDSPWGRLHRAAAKILTLGMGAKLGGTTFFHYVEKLYGVPYQYTKIYSAPVYSGGQLLPGPFTMSVRYLKYGIINTPVRVKTRMVEEKNAYEARTGRALSWCADAETIVDRMCAYFNEDRWTMLVQPPAFKAGDIPMDGTTGDLPPAEEFFARNA
jgi:aminoglycoside 3-N-acetyltransferase